MKMHGVILLFIVATHAAVAQGELWGMTTQGGPDDAGVIYKTSADGTGQTVQRVFTVAAGKQPIYCQMVEAPNGKLYGLTSDGGFDTDNAFGTNGSLFEFNPATGIYVTKHSFKEVNGNGGFPQGSLVLAPNGKLYGVTALSGNVGDGVLFEFDLSTNVFTNKIDFDADFTGRAPAGGMAVANGKLYGMTREGGAFDAGVIFEYDFVANELTKIFEFDATSGEFPEGVLTLANGKLYGLTSSGGTNNEGVLFEYDLDAGNLSPYTVKVQFGGPIGARPLGSLTLAPNGKLYGQTQLGGANDMGTLFEFDPDPLSIAPFQKKFDFDGVNGGVPEGNSLMSSNGKLYGMTTNGGQSNAGVLFEFDPTGGGTYAKKFNFNGATGSNPKGTIMQADNGLFYGLTYAGGVYDFGVLFEYDPADGPDGKFTKKIDLGGSINGAYPSGALLEASNGKFYGTTYNGGLSDLGVLFEYDRHSEVFIKKIDFNNADGSTPTGGLIEHSNGKFYGMTAWGGTADAGVLYEYLSGSNTYTNKFSFGGNNGENPQGRLTLAGNGNLYGLAQFGGANNRGVLFEFQPASGIVTKKIDLSLSLGSYPIGGLWHASNGKLYGMTSEGGTNNLGVLFEYDPGTNQYINKVDFDNSNGALPFGGLAETSGGKLYGMTSGGGATDQGVIFEYDISTSTLVKKFDFFLEVGTLPAGSFTLSGNGKLYGTTQSGGVNDLGTIIEYNPLTNTLVKTFDFEQAKGSSPLLSALIFVKGDQFITFDPLGAKTFGDAPFVLPAIASSGLPVVYSSSDPLVATVSGSTVTILGAGTAVITASQPGNASFRPAADVEKNLVVNKANQTITFDPLVEKSVSDAAFQLTATASSGLSVGFVSSNTNVATVSGNTVTIVGVGSTTITASQVGNVNYNAAADVEQVLVVNNKTGQSITFGPLTIKTYGDAPFALPATASSGLPITYTSNNPAVATVVGNMVTILSTGTTTIKASQAGDATFAPAVDVEQALMVVKANQIITFGALQDRVIGDPAFTLTATSTSSLVVNFSTTSDKIILASTQVTMVSAGRATISALQSGDLNFNAATPVERSFCIRPARPTINMTNADTESPTLTSSAATGNQWFKDGAALAGATNATLNVTAAGVYNVQVKVDDCVSDFSNDQAVIVTGDIDAGLNTSIQIYPNPASDWLTVSLGEAQGVKSISIVELSGREMDGQQISGNEAKFYVGQYSRGIYLVKVKADRTVKVARFVKN
jgi:uncharacterized repeat protein (TIGR03803 family)